MQDVAFLDNRFNWEIHKQAPYLSVRCLVAQLDFDFEVEQPRVIAARYRKVGKLPSRVAQTRVQHGSRPNVQS